MFVQIARLTECQLPSAVATCTLLTHTTLLRSCHYRRDLPPLPNVFSLCQSCVTVFRIAVVCGRLRVTIKWSQRLKASKGKAKSALRQAVLQNINDTEEKLQRADEGNTLCLTLSVDANFHPHFRFIRTKQNQTCNYYSSPQRADTAVYILMSAALPILCLTSSSLLFYLASLLHNRWEDCDHGAWYKLVDRCPFTASLFKPFLPHPHLHRNNCLPLEW